MTILNKDFDNNSPIALFDSGVGGLTVLNKLKKILPDESYVYYGDTLHMPYGDKTKPELLKFSSDIFRFFESKGCKAVVMACNTTSSVIYEDVCNNYRFKLFSIVHSVSKILASLDISSIGIFATRATIQSGAYQRLISKYNDKMSVYGQDCPDWVHFVEENSMNQPKNKEIIKSDLTKMLKNNPDKIVLGCTHYPFLTNVLSEFVSSDIFIDPAEFFAQYIKASLADADLLADKKLYRDEFYVSSNPKQFMVSSKMFYNLDREPELLTF